MSLLVLSVVTVLPVFGCGEGASTKPTVTAKPREEVADKGGTTPSNGEAIPNAGGVGTFTGTITIVGTPKVTPLNADKDPFCINNKNQIKDQSLLVNPENKGIENVFVYLAKKPKGAAIEPPPEGPDVFDQKFCTFVPHAKIVRVGRTINVLNDDPTSHNTHSFTKSPRNSDFNQLVNPGNREGVPMIFKGSEGLPVSIKCDIHPWMTASILPLDHDFADITDKDGKFEIQGLPAGEHVFVIWHERAGPLNRRYKVTIKADEPTDKNIEYSADKF